MEGKNFLNNKSSKMFANSQENVYGEVCLSENRKLLNTNVSIFRISALD